jgi:hypothetical protein
MMNAAVHLDAAIHQLRQHQATHGLSQTKSEDAILPALKM